MGDETVDAGKEGIALRLWRAREAVRQGELLLKTQTDVVTAMEARASAIIGWCAAIGAAIGGAVASGNVTTWVAAGIAPLLVSAGAALAVLWPKAWADPAMTIDMIDDWAERAALTTELEYVEGQAFFLRDGKRRNDARLEACARRLRVAWAGLALVVPVIAAVGLAQAVRVFHPKAAAVGAVVEVSKP